MSCRDNFKFSPVNHIDFPILKIDLSKEIDFWVWKFCNVSKNTKGPGTSNRWSY